MLAVSVEEHDVFETVLQGVTHPCPQAFFVSQIDRMPQIRQTGLLEKEVGAVTRPVVDKEQIAGGDSPAQRSDHTWEIPRLVE